MDSHKRKSDDVVPPSGDNLPAKRERRMAEYTFTMGHEGNDLDYDDYESDYGSDDGSDGMARSIYGQIKLDGSSVGSLSGHLFERPEGMGGGFYDACDEISAETHECSVLFFKDNGKLMSDFARTVSRSCNTGGYLHIDSIEVSETHRGQDLGLTLLQKCLDEHAGTWTIAMIQPFPLNTREEPEEGSSDRGFVALSRHFARIGFRQCDSNPASDRSQFWYLEACNYTGEILDRESVQHIEVVIPASEPVLSELTKEIRELIDGRFPLGNGTGLLVTTMFKQKIMDVLSRGANLDESGALHVAVANRKHQFLKALVELGASINHADHAGNTPLHIAASGFDASGATILLQLGADKKAKNHFGQTAAQLVRDERKIMSKSSLFGGRLDDVDATIAVLR